MRLAALLVLVSGCVHTQPVSLDTPAGRADLNARTAGRVATLSLGPDGPRAVRDLHVGPDETTWVDRLSGRPQSAPTAAVTAVSIRRGGLRRATLIGAGVGAGLGLVAWTGDRGGFLSFPIGLYLGGGAVYGAGVGAGVAVGQRERFVPAERLGVRPDTLGGR